MVIYANQPMGPMYSRRHTRRKMCGFIIIELFCKLTASTPSDTPWQWFGITPSSSYANDAHPSAFGERGVIAENAISFRSARALKCAGNNCDKIRLEFQSRKITRVALDSGEIEWLSYKCRCALYRTKQIYSQSRSAGYLIDRRTHNDWVNSPSTDLLFQCILNANRKGGPGAASSNRQFPPLNITTRRAA